MTEEVAKVFGVPFEVIPFKANPPGAAARRRRSGTTCTRCPSAQPLRDPVSARRGLPAGDPQPRDGGLGDGRRRCCSIPCKIPPEVEMKASLPTNPGRPSLTRPGRLEQRRLSTPTGRAGRFQELVFELART